MTPPGLTTYERSDISIRAALGLFGSVGLSIAAAFLAVAGTLALFGGRTPLSRDMPSSARGASPGMAAAQQAVREIELELEREPQWIDREKGVVRIPAGRATELVLDEGLPVRDLDR